MHSNLQWICIHAHLVEEASGREWNLYYWPAFGSRDGGLVLALYTGDRAINLGEFHLPVGTFEYDDGGANIRYKDLYISGSYPSYGVHAGGTDGSGEHYAVTLELEAESKSFEAVGHDVQLVAVVDPCSG